MRGVDEQELVATWNAFHDRMMWEGVLRKDAGNEVALRALTDLPNVSALEALAANRRLVELLTGRRWYVMLEAREAGATWADVGEALGITRQGAQDFYRRKIEEQEKHVPEFLDSARARAVIGSEGAHSGGSA